MFTLRFDMRTSAGSVPSADGYAAAVEMCAWSERRGAVLAVLSEHHGTEDGHLAAPQILAAAIAARTSQLAVMLAAVPLPFWDPVRLAEEMCALDLISSGRVSYVLGLGHRSEEYEHFGRDLSSRGRVADESLALLLRLMSGEEVLHDGRRIRVTPGCVTPGGPFITIAGGSRPAARRAARHGLGFISQSASADLRQYYEEECRRHGHLPGLARFPVPGEPTTVFVADDPDRAWAQIGPHLLHDAVSAASYRHADHSVASISRADSVQELRDEAGPYRILTVDEATDFVRAGTPLPLHPLCGGLPPEVAWHYLECAATTTESARIN